MAIIGTMTATVLIKIGEGEPIEVGVMDIDLIPKAKPVMRGAEMYINVAHDLDPEATARKLADRLRHLNV